MAEDTGTDHGSCRNVWDVANMQTALTFTSLGNSHVRGMQRSDGMFDMAAHEVGMMEANAARKLNTGQPSTPTT